MDSELLTQLTKAHRTLGARDMTLHDYYRHRDLEAEVKDIPFDDLPTLEDLRAKKTSPNFLTYTSEAAQMRTHFRDYVLHTVFEAARLELGEAIKSANVMVLHDYYEPIPPSLTIDIAADIDGERFGIVHRVVSEAIAKEAKFWSKSEKEDYSKRIHYSITPLKI